jgi:uncharacterized membrane protein YkvA (DUF1232 family)
MRSARTCPRGRDRQSSDPLRHRCEAGNATVPAGVDTGVATRFSPRRIAAFRALWRAVSRSRRPGSPGFGDRLRAVPRLLAGAVSGRYPDLGRGRLVMLVLAVAYLVAPVDLVPELFLMLLGLGDDAVVALWLGGAFLVETDRFLDWERRRPVTVDQDGRRLPRS